MKPNEQPISLDQMAEQFRREIFAYIQNKVGERAAAEDLSAWCAWAKPSPFPNAERSTQRAAVANSRNASSLSFSAFFNARSKISPSFSKLFSSGLERSWPRCR
jgi:hypothetical protein